MAPSTTTASSATTTPAVQVWPPAGVSLTGDALARRINAVTPKAISAKDFPDLIAFVRAAVYDINPGEGSVSRYLAVMAKHVHLHHATGSNRRSLVRSEMFALDTVTATGILGLPGYSERSKQTYMSVLRKTGHALAPQAGWAPEWKGAKHASVEPYSPQEVAALLQLGYTQPLTRGSYRRRITLAVLALGLGAGLVGEEMRLVRGTDVIATADAVLVAVRVAGKERQVPVLGVYEHLLLELAQAAGDKPLLGRSASPNVVSTIAAGVIGGGELPRINAHRMRRTWLAVVTPVAPISALLRATGRKNLDDLEAIADVTLLSDGDYRRILRCSLEIPPLQGQLALFPSYDLTEKRPPRPLLRSVA